jgi:hypothetical protein
MGKIPRWLVRFGNAAWSALGWQRTVLVAVVTYISTYWDRFVVWTSDYIPSGLYLQIFQVPGWAIAIVVAGTTAIYCSGYLTKVTQKGVNAGLTGPLPLTFAPAEDGKDALIGVARIFSRSAYYAAHRN